MEAHNSYPPNGDTELLDWMEKNPDKVAAVKGIERRKPEVWFWCWKNGRDWQMAFTLRSAIMAAMEEK